MRSLSLLLACAAFSACSVCARAQVNDLRELQVDARPAAGVPPALYSFADVYRLTVGAGLGTAALAAASETDASAPIRVAAAQAPEPEPAFSVRPVSDSQKWLLLLSGLAAAFWVARRRLAYL
jgi:hypothetical protein